ncbi:MAG TPA: S8 family serine peptidase [Propionibacteriaceae bacterium]|nr:S8 family serine peptidase [Propionibacteriaceae bacterium]
MDQPTGAGVQTFDPHEVIVGQQHQRLVLAKLSDAGAALSSEPQESDALGLTLLKLADVDAAADKLVQQVEGNPEAVARLAPYKRPEAPVERVLWAVRGLCAADFGGWTPSLAKNRIVGRVHGVGEVSYGGTDDPTPIDPPPSFPIRASGPGRGVRVGVLDTGLYPQDWLAGGWTARFSDTVRVAEPTFMEGHATFVTGLILAQAPGATVEVRRVLGQDGTADSWSVAEEIVRFGNSGLDILNLSFLCYTEDGQPPLVLATAVDRLDPGLVVVAAAGNHGRGHENSDSEHKDQDHLKPAWPAALDDVVAVGSCDADGKRADFSPRAPWIDLHAPGVALRSTFLNRATLTPGSAAVEFGGFASWSGTSFSAALVSGAIAAGADPGRISGQGALRDIVGELERRPVSSDDDYPPMFLDVATP